MCGITGVIDLTGVDALKLEQMTSIIRHRGPDDEGYVLYDKQFVCKEYKGNDSDPDFLDYEHIRVPGNNSDRIIGLGHRRLSIIDLKPSGHQPMIKSGVSLVYNGEIYNYIELRAELRTLGCQFETNTDSEVIINAYKLWGKQCVQRFRGMWAFALFDEHNRTLMLSRDRFGIKPMYYLRGREYLFFASEIKSIIAYSGKSPSLDKERLLEYVVHGQLSNKNNTLYKGLLELPPGENMIIQIGVDKLKFIRDKYFDLNDEVIPISDELSLQKQLFENMLQESVKIHMRSDVKVGSCLSGGLDSSAIVALASGEMKDETFHTFTAGYQDKKLDESYYANKVIAHFTNINGHFTYPSHVDFWQDFDKLIWHQEQPFASSSIFAQWAVMKSAAERNVKVLLDGQGADEVLGGYSYFGGAYLWELMKNRQFKTFLKEAQALKQNRSINIYRELARAAFPFFPGLLKAGIRKRARIGASMLNKDFYDTFKGSLNPQPEDSSFRERSISAIKGGLRDLLRYEDRNSMAFSIEARVPFLDHHLVILGINLSTSSKINNGWSKYILRKSIENILPSIVVWRRDKKGFVTPQYEWKRLLKQQLVQYVNNVDLPDCFDREAINAYAKSNDIRSASHLSEFWKVISVLKWLDIYKLN